MDINFEIIDENLQECWEYYKEYIREFKIEHYSDAKPDDFIEWCENELYECPNCYQILRKDYMDNLNEPFNCDNVCDDCIKELGYYD